MSVEPKGTSWNAHNKQERTSKVSSEFFRNSISQHMLQDGSVNLPSHEVDAIIRNLSRKEKKINKLWWALGFASIFSVALFALTFASALAANEKSKESHIKDGSLEDLSGNTVATAFAESNLGIWASTILSSFSLARVDYVTLPLNRVGTEEATFHVASAIKRVDGTTLLTTDGSEIDLSPSDWTVTIQRPTMEINDDNETVPSDPIVLQLDAPTEGDHVGEIHVAGTDEYSYGDVIPSYDSAAMPSEQCVEKWNDELNRCYDDNHGEDQPFCDCIDAKKAEIEAACDGDITGLGHFDDVLEVCNMNPDRRQLMWGEKKGRDNVVDYGWCSISIGFLAGKIGIGNGRDTANYCDTSQSCDSYGGCSSNKAGHRLSNCCITHDKCLQKSDFNHRCSHDHGKCGQTCDIELRNCAWGISCWYGRGWGTRYDLGCATASTAVAAAMSFKPNNGWGC